MKIITGICICMLSLFACKSKKTAPVTVAPTEDSVISYFPVTNFLRGQLTEINSNFVTPLKFTIKDNKKDSVWIKQEDFETAFAPFLHPVIDTANLASMFKESKFLDQSVAAFTFTYDPKGNLPDTMKLRHWDVYVNPQTGKVKRVYILKEPAAGKQTQLTWEAEERWAKIVDVSTTPDGKFSVDQEQLITWKP